MIIRDYVQCETCEHNYTVRIGMGRENEQWHKFPCKNCGEIINVGLKIDFINISTEVLVGENTEHSIEEGTIMYMDANFVSDPTEDNKNFMFPRLRQMEEMYNKDKELVDEIHGDGAFEKAFEENEYPIERSDYKAEWKELKRAWSLKRNGKIKLSEKRVLNAKERYLSDPITSLDDWIWRFCSRLAGPISEVSFKNVFNEFKEASNLTENFEQFVEYFGKHLINRRAGLYFTILDNFFDTYDDFSQIHFYAFRGMDIPENHKVSSSNFDRTRMFYGRAFEIFSELIETLACVNNVLHGREYDTFETMDLKKYRMLDKSSRSNPFSENNNLYSICEEMDNVIRNASHHENMEIDLRTGMISYQAGKGGQGNEMHISYSDYLYKCDKLFLSILILLRIDLLISLQIECQFINPRKG